MLTGADLMCGYARLYDICITSPQFHISIESTVLCCMSGVQYVTLARRKDLSLTENDHLAHDIVEF